MHISPTYYNLANSGGLGTFDVLRSIREPLSASDVSLVLIYPLTFLRLLLVRAYLYPSVSRHAFFKYLRLEACPFSAFMLKPPDVTVKAQRLLRNRCIPEGLRESRMRSRSFILFLPFRYSVLATSFTCLAFSLSTLSPEALFLGNLLQELLCYFLSMLWYFFSPFWSLFFSGGQERW